MTTMTITRTVLAGRWLRVSTGSQDEWQQEPAIDRFIADRGWTPGKTYPLNDVSAFDGEQDAMFEKVLADVRAGVINVLVIFSSSRLDRRGIVSALGMIRRVRDAGGWVACATEPWVEADDELTGAVSSWVNWKSSADKSVAIRNAYANMRDAGFFVGTTPAGYEKHGRKRETQLRVTPAGEEWIPQIFTMAADGMSSRDIARILHEKRALGRAWVAQHAGRPDTVRAASVIAIIRNTCYRGLCCDREGRGIYECPPLVSAALWNKANEKITGKAGKARGRAPKTMLSGALRCAVCGGTRYQAGMDSKRKTSFYACRAATGCGTVNMAKADAAFESVMRLYGHVMMFDEVEIPGTDHSDEIDRLVRKESRLGLKYGRDWQGRNAESAALQAEIQRLEALPVTEKEIIEVATGYTWWEEWNGSEKRDDGSQDRQGVALEDRAKWITDHMITVAASKTEMTVTLPWTGETVTVAL